MTTARTPDVDLLRQIKDLFALGAHFISVDGDSKQPINPGSCTCEDKAWGGRSHNPDCGGSKPPHVGPDDVLRRYRKYEARVDKHGFENARPMVAVVLSTIGLAGVDIDPKDVDGKRIPVTQAHVSATRLAFGCWIGGDRGASFAEDTGIILRTMNNGAHLLWRVNPTEGNVIEKQGNWNWSLTPRAKVLPGAYDDEYLASGDFRYDGGYIALYEGGIEGVCQAAYGEGPSHDLTRPESGRVSTDLRRYWAPAKLATASPGERHTVLASTTMTAALSDAVDNADSFHHAAQLIGWSVNDPHETGNPEREIDDAWASAVSKSTDDKGRPPDAAQWQSGVRKRDQHRRGIVEEPCVLSDRHDDYDDRNAEAFALIDGRIRAFEFARYELKPDNAWDKLENASAVNSRIQAMLSDAGVCRKCLSTQSGMVQSVLKRIEADGMDTLSPLRMAFLVNGVIHVLDTMDELADRLGYGIEDIDAHERLRPCVPDDLNIYRPALDIGPLDPQLMNTPCKTEHAMVNHLGFEVADVAWALRSISRADRGASKRVLFIMADAGSGKSTIITVIKKIFANNAAVSYGGRGVEKYQMGTMQRATFVFVDEAQNVDRNAWGDFKDRIGGAEAVPREMYAAPQPRESRMTAMMLTERRAFDFGMHNAELMQEGWSDERITPVISKFRNRMPGHVRDELLSDAEAKHLAQRIIATDPDHKNESDTHGTPRMCADRDYIKMLWRLKLIEANGKKGAIEMRIEITDDGRLIDTDKQAETWAPADLSSDAIGDNRYKHKVTGELATKQDDGEFVKDAPAVSEATGVANAAFNEEGEDLPW